MGDFVPLKKWRENIEQRRLEVLLAIKFLVRTLQSREDLTDLRIGQQLAEIGRSIVECGLSEDLIDQTIKEVQGMAEPGDADHDEIVEKFAGFANILQFPVKDKSPETSAMREKQVAKVIGGHALARKLAEEMA